MIYPYVGDFLINPVPLQLSFNWCSHACSYCFANLNNPSRSFDTKELQRQLKSIFSNNTLQAALLRMKYPVIISNLVDPFATSNYAFSIPTIELMTSMGIPIAFQTRGGKGIDDVIKNTPPSVWYISVPMFDDDIRRKIEPAAPSIKSRLDLIDSLTSAGHQVIVGINPTVEDWLPKSDYKILLHTLKKMGVSGIWVAALHFNTKQLKIMPEKDKVRLGERIIAKGLKNARELQKDCFMYIDELKNYSLQNGLHVEGMFEGEPNSFFDVYQKTYPNVFPTIHSFINWCHQSKGENEPVYYHEFEDQLLPQLIKGAYNVSPYMRCMSQSLDEEVRQSIGYKQSFQWLLNLCWNERRMKRQPNRYWTFAQSVNYDGETMTENRDTNGNLVFHFNKNTYEEDFFITN